MSDKPKRVPNPRGRPVGSKNKSTEAIKYTYVLLMERNAPKIDKWLQEVAKDDPAKAIDLVIKLGEYVLPKMKQNLVSLTDNRTEIDYNKLSDEELAKLWGEISKED